MVPINVPPLRERPEDIAALINHFVTKYNQELKCECPGYATEAMDAMCGHRWPGNVRELQNVVERSLIFSGNRAVRTDDLSIPAGGAAPLMPSSLDLRAATRDFEKRHIARVLGSFEHNKVASAQALGIGLSSLYRKMEELGISKTRDEHAAAM